MAFELLAESPSLLQEGYIVRFSEGWEDTTNKANRWFQVFQALSFRYDAPRIIASGDTQDLAFDLLTGNSLGNVNLGLIPESSETVYELLIGLSGSDNLLIYPRYANSYYLELEASGITPDVTDARRRYLGFYSPSDSPKEAPRLREHTVNKMQAPVLRVYNDSNIAQKLDLHFIVNRCHIMEITPGNFSEAIRQRARMIRHYKTAKW